MAQEGVPDNNAHAAFILNTGAVATRDDPFYQWLESKSLQMLYGKLVDQGFESTDDFQGLSEDSLKQVWSKMGIDKIGISNRFFKAFRPIAASNPVLSANNNNRSNQLVFVMSNQEQSVIQKMKNALNHIDDQIKKFGDRMEGMQKTKKKIR